MPIAFCYFICILDLRYQQYYFFVLVLLTVSIWPLVVTLLLQGIVFESLMSYVIRDRRHVLLQRLYLHHTIIYHFLRTFTKRSKNYHRNQLVQTVEEEDILITTSSSLFVRRCLARGMYACFCEFILCFFPMELILIEFWNFQRAHKIKWWPFSKTPRWGVWHHSAHWQRVRQIIPRKPYCTWNIFTYIIFVCC